MKYTFICRTCRRKYTIAVPDPRSRLTRDKWAKHVSRICCVTDCVTKEGDAILRILNTIENSTVEDAAKVLKTIRKDTLKRYKSYEQNKKSH